MVMDVVTINSDKIDKSGGEVFVVVGEHLTLSVSPRRRMPAQSVGE